MWTHRGKNSLKSWEILLRYKTESYDKEIMFIITKHFLVAVCIL